GAADLNREIVLEQESQIGREAEAGDAARDGGSIGDGKIEYALKAAGYGPETKAAIGVDQAAQRVRDKFEKVRQPDIARIDVEVDASVVIKEQRGIAQRDEVGASEGESPI